MRVHVYADVSNLYHCIGLKWRGRKLDYQALMNFVAKRWARPTRAYAYGAQMEHEAAGFIHCLKKSGWTPKYKVLKRHDRNGQPRVKVGWDVGIAIDMVQSVAEADLLVLCSADGGMAPAVQYVREEGVDVIVVACGISRDLKKVTTCIEIPESLLEAKRDSAATD
jgi:uncharacterized LabA/DUF88 family protein